MDERTTDSLMVQYQVVAARRLQWDNLVWQVPILSLTAQAFLFTIALGSDTRPLARLASGLLSLVVTVLSITLMARHRQAEEADADWLEDFELTHFGPDGAMHGHSFARRRDRFAPHVPGRRLGPLAKQFRAWTYGLAVFGAVAVGVLVWAVVDLVR